MNRKARPRRHQRRTSATFCTAGHNCRLRLRHLDAGNRGARHAESIDFCRYAEAIRQPLLGAGRCEQRAYVDRPRPWARTDSARPRDQSQERGRRNSSTPSTRLARRQRFARNGRGRGGDRPIDFRLGEVRMPPSLSSSREPEAEYQAVTTFELKMTRVAAVDGSITMHRADSSRSAICGSASQTTILARIQRAKTRSPMPASERQLMRRRPGCSSGTSSKSKTRRRKVQCCLPRKHRRYGA